MISLQAPGSAARARQFEELCAVVYARVTSEPQSAIEILRSARLRVSGLTDRTLYRALQHLVDTGRVVRVGEVRGGHRRSSTYARSAR